jgi:hypothetical protein
MRHWPARSTGEGTTVPEKRSARTPQAASAHAHNRHDRNNRNATGFMMSS